MNLVFWASLGLAVFSVLVGPVLPIGVATSVVGGIAFFLALNAVVRRKATPVKIVTYLVAPLAVLFAMYFVAFLALHRIVAVVLIGGIALALVYLHGAAPFEFYRDWLYTNPRLKPETRANPKPIRTRPNVALFAIILAVVAVVPFFSPTVAILAVAAICIAALRTDLKPLGFLRKLKLVFGQYFTYGMASTDAPGVWIPETSWTKRRRVLWAVTIPVFLTLAIGLHLFAPWDGLRWKIASDYGREAVPAAFAEPFGWVFPVMQGLADADAAYLWVFPVTLGFAVALPFLVLAAAFRAPLAEAYALHREIEGEGEGESRIDPTVDFDKSRPEWQWYVDRIKDSDQACPDPIEQDPKRPIREADHLFLGVQPHAQFPVLLHRKALDEHCYIVGDTGSGKTALGIMPLLMQLIRGSRDPEGKTSLPPPMVVIDLKGDMALFQSLRMESERRRKELDITDVNDDRFAFRFFTPEKGKDSFIFNPFQSLDSESRSIAQLSQLILDSLSLNHGEGYGRSYYSRKSRMMVYDALTKDTQRPRSIEELFKTLKKLTGTDESGETLQGDFNYKHDSFELLATIHTLSKYEMLATADNLDNPDLAISMAEVLEKRQIVYFFLPAALESIAVREIAKLAVFSLLTAAIDRQRADSGKGLEPRQTYLVIDEFQRIAADNFKVILEQARSFGISAILANQTQSDLKTHDIDLRPTIRGNTRVKMHFSVTDPDEERSLSESSGHELAMLGTGVGVGDAAAVPTQWAQSLKPRLTRNDIMAASDHPLEYILKVSRGSGFTQFGGLPIPVRTCYPLTRDDYEARKRMPWPKLPRELPKRVVQAKESPGERENERERLASQRALTNLEAFNASPPDGI